MKLLVVCGHYDVCSGRYITDALKRRGVDVRHIGEKRDLREAWQTVTPERYAWQPDGGLTTAWEDWTPDAIIIADSALRGYQHPVYRDVKHIVWGVDNHVRSYRAPGMAHYFLAHKHGPEQPVKEPDETWLPCGYDGDAFRPSDIPYTQREYDVCMLGVMYPKRLELVEALTEAGLKVYTGTGQVYEEYAKAYQNSRISLCNSAAGDVSQRVFETAAMGCAVLTDPLLDLSDAETNKALGLAGFFVYWSVDECVRQAQEIIRGEPPVMAGILQLQAIVRSAHTWDMRADVVMEWVRRNVAVVAGERKPYLNLGCGRTHFPSNPPPGHHLPDAALYQYPLWINIDKVKGVGADLEFDLFQYPWPLADNSAAGAVLSHLCEHIPHEIRVLKTKETAARARELAGMQDGWYAFFAELWRVLEPGALAHVIAPYGWSDGAITDPTHTRYLTVNTFTHAMDSDDGGSFKYVTGGRFVLDIPPRYTITEMFKHLGADEEKLRLAIMIHTNVVYDFYVQLRAVK